jgi:hypothetical protein
VKVASVAQATTCQEAIDKIWPVATRAQAYVVFKRESGLRANAINVNVGGSIDYGCAQLNTIHLGTNGWTTYQQAYNPEFNINYALRMFNRQGWRPWYGAQGIYW